MAYTAVKFADVQKAIAAVKLAQSNYDTAIKNTSSTSAAKTAVNTALKNLDAARAKLDSLQSDFNNEKYLTTDAGYKTANTNLTNAQKALDAARAFVDSNDYLNRNTTYQNALKNITAKEQARDKAQSALDNATDKNRAALQKAYNSADAAVNAAYTAKDTAERNARVAAEKSITTAETAFNQKQRLLDTARDAAQATAQKAIDAQANIINGEKNTKNLERLYDNAQNAYQKIVDTIQPAIDARNDAIGNVSNYINDIRGSLGDITTGADVKAVQTLLSQIQTTVNGTKISDLINPVNAMISQIDPMKMSNIPTLNAGFKNLSPDVFSNIDRNTGLPILNQGALDKVLNKYGGNTLTSSQYRDNWDKFGWNSKSDGSRVAHGAAIVGIDYGSMQSGMTQTKGFVKTGTTGAATDADFKNAAEQLGIDVNQYYKGKTLDKQSLYNDINNRLQDFYVVGNALETPGANKAAEHAAVLFKADGSGNLIPVTKEDGSLAASYYSTPTVIHEGSGLGSFLPVLAVAGSFFLPGITAGLAGAIEGTTLGATLGTAGSAAMAGAITNAGLAAITGGDIGNAALMGGAGALATVKSADIANGALGGVENVQKIADIAGLNLAQTQKIIANGVVTGLASGAVDPDNVLQNVTSSVASGFTSAQAKNEIGRAHV